MKIVIVGFGVTGQSILRFCLKILHFGNDHSIKNDATIDDVRKIINGLCQADLCDIIVLDDKIFNDNFDENVKKICCEDFKIVDEDDFVDFYDLCKKRVNFSKIIDFNIDVLNEEDYIFLSPGIKMQSDFVKSCLARNIKILNDIELLLQLARVQKNIYGDYLSVIGITGSNGKSTTTSLVAHVLKENFSSINENFFACGNLGYAALYAFDKMQVLLKKAFFEHSSAEKFCMQDVGKKHCGYVIEISSAQLVNVKSCNLLDYGILLNITENHIDFHGSMDNYADAKSKILLAKESLLSIDSEVNLSLLEKCSNGKIECQNLDIMSVQDKQPVRIYGSSTSYDLYKLVDSVFYKNDVVLCRLDNNHIPQYSLLVAFFILYKMGCNILDVNLKNFSLLPHRLENFLSISWNGNTVEFINDSKSTTIESTIFALKHVNRLKKLNHNTTIYLIIGGGDAKKHDFSRFRDAFDVLSKSKIFMIGESKSRISDALRDIFQNADMADVFEKNCKLCESIYEAVDLISCQNLGDAFVLLSPACESFDQYNNFNHRGDCFKEYVRSRFSHYDTNE